MACSIQVKLKTHLVALAVLALLLPCAPVKAESETPSARELLARVRANQAGQDRDLTGKLRTSSSEAKIEVPFQLFLRGNTITYRFTDKPEALVLRLGEKNSRLDRVTGSGKTEKIAGAKLDDPVRGTDISYEDLSLKFLYWNNAIVEKETETRNMRTCWIVRAVPSSKEESQYDMARLWIEQTGGLLQAECYSHGKLIRRFSVSNVQRAKGTGGYILKSMTIQRLEGGSKDRYPTQLIVNQN